MKYIWKYRQHNVRMRATEDILFIQKGNKRYITLIPAHIKHEYETNFHKMFAFIIYDLYPYLHIKHDSIIENP